MIAAAVVAICLGALLGGWAWSATTSTQEVLAARADIERGSVIEADDLVSVRINSDSALSPVSAGSLESVIGQRAAVDIAAGSLLTPSSYADATVPSEDMSVVGVALTSSQAPGMELRTGDRVRVIVTPAEGSDAPTGTPSFSEAEIVGVRVSDDTGQLVVDLLVPHGEAATLAAQIATGNVALVLDSRAR
ncbi:SAF domain-containing protein [Nocardioides daejeonensis]|uniref:SAF domain-containing protein n=1 Tax=Nocardioides daejeonensis TaxID=1046556 RepID=UPI0013A5303F|nr:SAF domain-containing protein [Nocardioides daejeonensis]